MQHAAPQEAKPPKYHFATRCSPIVLTSGAHKCSAICSLICELMCTAPSVSSDGPLLKLVNSSLHRSTTTETSQFNQSASLSGQPVSTSHHKITCSFFCRNYTQLITTALEPFPPGANSLTSYLQLKVPAVTLAMKTSGSADLHLGNARYFDD